jgi:deoxyribodipyrimidine photo-lyase
MRRDLRLHDNAALYHALAAHAHVLCVFVFDPQILDPLPPQDRRVAFIWRQIEGLKQALIARGSDLCVRHGRPQEVIPHLAAELTANDVYCAEDYEPAAMQRDAAVTAALAAIGCRLQTVQDQVIFARDRLLTHSRQPYSVFTPYKNAWLAALTPDDWQPYGSEALLSERLLPCPPTEQPRLAALGFAMTDLDTLGIGSGPDNGRAQLARFAAHIDRYDEQRDFPALDATSHLSVHLRFGTVSVREAVAFAATRASNGAAAWRNELIWREFYQQLLWHAPYIESESFRPQYRQLAFENRRDWFDAWCTGRTGFPLIDAAMRQLLQTGWMHNRLRMIVASFLVKDLLIDWRWGEQHFARWLLDYDLAANNGGWQWAASTGCDAQPWFRIFNPLTQSRRFDPDGDFIRRYLPELAGLSAAKIHAPTQAAAAMHANDYPAPIVDHAQQRQKALALFGRQ